jgi:hypothetical protein
VTDDSDSDTTEQPSAAPVASGGVPAADDVVVLGSESADGKSVGVVRLREGQIEIGRVQPLEEGRPIVGEVVKLTPRVESPRVCDVEVQYKPSSTATAREAREVGSEPRPTRARSGPAQVASDEYRRNWDVIWARKKKPTQPS